MSPEIRKLLVDADSYLSLVAYRYRVGTIPDDVVEEMKRISLACRQAYEAHDRATDPAPLAAFVAAIHAHGVNSEQARSALARLRSPPPATAEPTREGARPDLEEVTDKGGEPVAYFTRERINAVAFEAMLRSGSFTLDLPGDLADQIAYEWWRETSCDCGDHRCHYEMAVPTDPDALAVTVWHVDGRGWLGHSPASGGEGT